jgi:hypothetical protein
VVWILALVVLGIAGVLLAIRWLQSKRPGSRRGPPAD